jgi:hypothetical protein
VAELTERLGQNSHPPPSSDPPGAAGKGGGQRPKLDRPRGGQRVTAVRAASSSPPTRSTRPSGGSGRDRLIAVVLLSCATRSCSAFTEGGDV